MRASIVAAVLLSAAPAGANMNETLDVSAHVIRTSFGDFDANGLAMRSGRTDHDFRYGSGLGVSAPPMHAAWLTLEAFVAYAPNGYENFRPYVELRGHVDRLQMGSASYMRGGFGPRFGVLFPLSEYFFVDAGIGRDIVGCDELRGTIGLGLPIPISHL